MAEPVISLRECAQGWRVFQGENPLFWFRSYDQAMRTARLIASVQADIHDADTSIEMRLLGERPVLVGTCTPGH